jgi:malate synthase
LYQLSSLSHDVISAEDGAEKRDTYNPRRGGKVIAKTEAFLDGVVALEAGKYSDVAQFTVSNRDGVMQLVATLKDGSEVGLADARKFAGCTLKHRGCPVYFSKTMNCM